MKKFFSIENPYNPQLYSEENIDFYEEFEEKVRKYKEKEKNRLKNLKIRLEIVKND